MTEQKLDNWKVRRRIVFLTLIFCAGTVIYLLVYGEDNNLHKEIVGGCFTLGIGTLATYIAGAVWDDNWKKK